MRSEAFLARLRRPATASTPAAPPERPTATAAAAGAAAPHPRPARAELSDEARLARFTARLHELDVAVAVAPSRAAALAAIARLVSERGVASICGPAGLCSDALAPLWSDDPATADLGLSLADWAIAETGSVVVCSGPDSARAHSLLPPTTAFLVPASRLLATLGDALRALTAVEDVPACVSTITGPSSTADISGIRCVGVHGPREVLVWILTGE